MGQITATSEQLSEPRARAARGQLGGRTTGLLMALPVTVIVAAFTLYAFGQAIYESTQLSSPFFPARFVGLDNFRKVAGSSYFGDAVRVTATFAALAVPIVVVVSLL